MDTSELAATVRAEPVASCSRFDALIARLGTDALGAEDEARVRAHLAACERCAELARLFAGEPISDEDDGGGTAEVMSPVVSIVAGATIAGRYRLDRILGRGGMGVVWAATQSLTGQPVAIKLLDERSGDLRARRRFLREARSACAARHPNVVRVYDVIELSGGAPAIVMELLAGHSLQRRLDHGPTPLGDVCHVLARVAAAVSAAHAAGIVHRDLKPENVFLARAPGGGVEVKVLDFGVAKRTALASEHSSGNLTRTGALVGTPYYMSPEQALGEDDVDARADIWALGVMLYEGLSGVLPTRADNLGRVIKAVAMMPIAPIESLVPGLPPDLAELLARMLSKARDGRPQEMEDVRVVLARHESASLEARPDLDIALPSLVVAPILEASVRLGAAPSISLPVDAPRARASRALIAALGASLLLGAGGLVSVLGSGRPARGVVVAVTPQPSDSSAAPPVAPEATATASPSSSVGSHPLVIQTPHVPPRGEGRGRSLQVSPALPSPAPPSAPSASSGIGVEREF